jgi:hypothetical protein
MRVPLRHEGKRSLATLGWFVLKNVPRSGPILKLPSLDKEGQERSELGGCSKKRPAQRSLFF